MNKNIVLNGTVLNVDQYEESDFTNENTGKNLTKINFEFTSDDEERAGLLKLFEQDAIAFEVPDEEKNLKVRKTDLSYSYTQGRDLTRYSVTLEEIDPEDNSPKSTQDIIARSMLMTLNLAADNWKRTRAIAELLQEKGVFTKEEYQDKLNLVFERDHKEIMGKLVDEFEAQLGVKVPRRE
ncbi:hypothetical protein ACFCW7_00005 [Paenibacillus glucanolyticus]|uniref:hypothetical protein n=1 Tax=Paenibacillus glucanolyticus TaxID=59843 RepID=UPI0035D6DD81